MCRWMGSYFHDWIDYNGIAQFRFLGGKTAFAVLETYQNVTVDEK